MIRATWRNRLATIALTIAWSITAPVVTTAPKTAATATVLALLGAAAAASYTDAHRKDQQQ